MTTLCRCIDLRLAEPVVFWPEPWPIKAISGGGWSIRLLRFARAMDETVLGPASTFA
jgi:hypothetical protein